MCVLHPSEPVAPQPRLILMAAFMMIRITTKAKRSAGATHARVRTTTSGAALAWFSTVSVALGQWLPTIPPSPPPRPAWLDSGRATNPESLAPLAPPALSFAPQAPTKKMPPQPVLPPYERAAMRACGSEWKDMKLAGAADGRIWRDFAAECLRRRVGGR